MGVFQACGPPNDLEMAKFARKVWETSRFCWPFILPHHVELVVPWPHLSFLTATHKNAHLGGLAGGRPLLGSCRGVRVRFGDLDLSRAMAGSFKFKLGEYLTLHVQQYQNVWCIHDIQR